MAIANAADSPETSDLLSSFELVSEDELKQDAISFTLLNYHVLPIQAFTSINTTRNQWKFILNKFHINEQQIKQNKENKFSFADFNLLMSDSTTPEKRLGVYVKFREFLHVNAKCKQLSYFAFESFTKNFSPISLKFNEFYERIKYVKLQHYLNEICLGAAGAHEHIYKLYGFVEQCNKISYQFFEVRDPQKPDEPTPAYCFTLWDTILAAFKINETGQMESLYPFCFILSESFFCEALSCIGRDIKTSHFTSMGSASVNVQLVQHSDEIVKVQLKLFFKPQELPHQSRQLKFSSSLSCLTIYTEITVGKSALIKSMELESNACRFSDTLMKWKPFSSAAWLLSIPYIKSNGSEFDKYLTYFPEDKKAQACSLLNTFCDKDEIDILRVDAFERCKNIAKAEYRNQFAINERDSIREYQLSEQRLCFNVYQC